MYLCVYRVAHDRRCVASRQGRRNKLCPMFGVGATHGPGLTSVYNIIIICGIRREWRSLRACAVREKNCARHVGCIRNAIYNMARAATAAGHLIETCRAFQVLAHTYETSRNMAKKRGKHSHPNLRPASMHDE